MLSSSGGASCSRVMLYLISTKFLATPSHNTCPRYLIQDGSLDMPRKYRGSKVRRRTGFPSGKSRDRLASSTTRLISQPTCFPPIIVIDGTEGHTFGASPARYASRLWLAPRCELLTEALERKLDTLATLQLSATNSCAKVLGQQQTGFRGQQVPSIESALIEPEDSRKSEN